MSAQGLNGLRQAAEALVPDEVKVTPELRARLWQRIEQAERQGVRPERLQRSWLRPAAYTAAVAAALTLALLAGQPPLQSSQSKRDAALPQSLGMRAPFQPASTGPAKATLNVELKDAYGNVTKSYSSVAADSDQRGTTVPGPLTQQGAAEAQPGRKIITNGEYGLRVQDARSAMDRLQREAIAAGGYVAEATLNKGDNGSWVGQVVLRVPANKAAATIQTLSQMGTVERERQWTQDVTDQWLDIDHRTAILREHEQRLRDLAEKAATFDDWNRLATQINNTRVEIENLTGRMKLLANQVEFAILNIQMLQPAPGEAPVPAKSATTFSGQMGEAFANSVRYLITAGRQTVVGLSALAPFALALVPLGLALFIVRRSRRSKGA